MASGTLSESHLEVVPAGADEGMQTNPPHPSTPESHLEVILADADASKAALMPKSAHREEEPPPRRFEGDGGAASGCVRGARSPTREKGRRGVDHNDGVPYLRGGE